MAPATPTCSATWTSTSRPTCAALLPLVSALVSGHSEVAIGSRLAPGLAGRPRAQAGADLPLLQPAPALRAPGAVLRRPVRLQGDPRRRRPPAAAGGRGPGLVLRHRAARPAPSGTGCGSTRSRSTGSTTRTRASTSSRPRSPTCAASLRLRLVDPVARFLDDRRRSPRWRTRCCTWCCAAGLGATAANALALALTAVANTQANRRFTFRIRGRAGLVRQHAAGALVYLLALALTAGALDVLRSLDPRPATWLEVTVLVVASAVATVTRYVALRTWVFARARRDPVEPPHRPPLTPPLRAGENAAMPRTPAAWSTGRSSWRRCWRRRAPAGDVRPRPSRPSARPADLLADVSYSEFAGERLEREQASSTARSAGRRPVS